MTLGDDRARCRALLEQMPDSGLPEVMEFLASALDFYSHPPPPPTPKFASRRIPCTIGRTYKRSEFFILED